MTPDITAVQDTVAKLRNQIGFLVFEWFGNETPGNWTEFPTPKQIKSYHARVNELADSVAGEIIILEDDIEKNRELLGQLCRNAAALMKKKERDAEAGDQYMPNF